MKTYRHIIFDIDGTLIDTEKAILESLKDTILEILHKTVPDDDLRFVLGIPGNVALHKLGITDTENASLIWNKHLPKYKSLVKIFDGIPELLASLKAEGYKLGIVTSKTRSEYIADFASPFGISGYFDTIICVEDAPLPKPAPEPLLAYLSKTSIDASDALYIGDTAYDSRCAQSANVDFGLAVWGNNTATATDIFAKYIFKTPSSILAMQTYDRG